MTALVSVRGLSATAGAAVLVDDISFEVAAGAVTALVGASGSGKTTSALALLGEHGDGVRLTGRIEIAGQLVVDGNGVCAAASGMRGRVVAYMPQHPGSALNPARRIGATLRELAKLHGGDVDEAIRAAQLPADPRTVKRFPHQFSGGQRQRVALAQTLACRPRVLVLDEPSTGLDSITRFQLVHELQTLASDGLGILLLSHDLALVRALAARVVVLDAGRVIAAGGPDVLPETQQLSEPETKEPGTKEPGQPLLKAMNLSAAVRRRGREVVLHDVGLAVRAGGCLGIVGRSGSGKTTLARCLAGLHERYTGTILLDDEPLPVLRRRSREQHRRVQYVWQEVRGSFDERRPVDHQVARTAQRLRGVSPDQAHDEAVATLARLGVAAATAARPPSRLSGGELQRAALARAVLADPDVLICDEITTALDERGTTLVLDLLYELRDRGTALIWIGHDLRLVGAVADDVLVLDAGRVVEQGSPASITTAPHHPLTQHLVAAAHLDAGSTGEREPVEAAVLSEAPPVTTINSRSEPRR
ncbi:ATP-binding cassette domain-containing protein [Kribbella sp. NPDC048915]|uniref:ABC transporter ATP-binding protein n=1 Tax=Kribbella sp. NPDC048915 TaxID=3155148 RepID=UPI0033EF43F5